MKKQVLTLALVAFMSIASAANSTGNGNPENNGVGPGNGGAGGNGGNGTATAISGAAAGAVAGASAGASAGVTSTIGNTVRNDVSSTNLNANSNTVRQGQEQGQLQGQQQQAVSSSGGNRLSNEGNNSAQSTSVTVQGDVTQSNTPPVVAGVLPSVPTSCRLYLFGGGSTRDGAGSGTFPIGNDQTCLSIAALNLMERAGGFTLAEKQAVVCKVEGMAEFPTCKNLAAPK